MQILSPSNFTLKEQNKLEPRVEGTLSSIDKRISRNQLGGAMTKKATQGDHGGFDKIG